MAQQLLVVRNRQSFIGRIYDLILLRLILRRSSKNRQFYNGCFSIFAHDYIGARVFIEGIYEKEELNDLQQLLLLLKINTSEATMVDIGANIGNHSIYFSPIFKSIFSFELNRSTYAILQANSSMYENIKTENIGIGARSEKVKIYDVQGNAGGSSAVWTSNQQSSLDGEIRPLDDIFQNEENIKLIKIDVEGMESEVLQGAVKTIKRNQPVVAFELNASDFGDGDPNSVKILKSLGYHFCWIESVMSSPNKVVRFFKLVRSCVTNRTSHILLTGDPLPVREHRMVFALPSAYAAYLEK